MRVFFIADTRVDGQAGDTTHVRELFDNLQSLADAYLVAPYGREKPDHERVLSIPKDFTSIPVLQTLLFRTAFACFLAYQTVRRSPDAFYLRHSPQAVLPAFVAKAFGIPLVVEVNSIPAEDHESTDKRPWLTRVILATERINFELADRFVVVTPGIGDYIRRRYGVADDRLTFVPNGANVDLFEPEAMDDCKEELGLDPDTSYVCFVGNLAPWQGVRFLLRSAPAVLSAVPDAEFLIVGDGIQRDELEELTAELGVEDDVRFTGTVPYGNVPRYVNASDLCVAYLVPFESGYSPLKLHEYMACGRPVVASDTRGFEILEQSGGGVLVRPEDPDALAETITELLRDDAARETMGANGRRYVVDNRSWRATAEEVGGVIADVTGGRSTDG